ncbi:PQQ-binding-like beta-propeller repeat protein [Gordonia soli]|uniref:Uncharacterized protein n=1 Tax=Gordonia soli NBRC 108243 TaxID=1223545 RepID=M0QRZ5_9ACTN|nr:PQQ-binding-like beta-propeller repeat protein [Gordonia soli]GAC70557.1 hypothetical protein GS4_36_00430 [Gordonia soli NBRC 108243]
MSVLSSVTGAARRLPFGIGTVSIVLVAALIACVGVVLAMGTPDTPDSYESGLLRSYPNAPAVAWTQSSDTLPGFGADTDIQVVDTWQESWLLAYPSGIGRAFLAVDRRTGAPLWDKPVISGLGGCAFDSTGTVGCAVKVGTVPDGFYVVDDDGTPRSRSPLDDTADVVGLGSAFLRIDQAGYGVSVRTPAGKTLWNRTFAAAAAARVEYGVVVISTVDGSEFVVDPRTGADRVACSVCEITVYPSGITVQHNEFGDEHTDTYGLSNGSLTDKPVWSGRGLRVVPGPTVLPVLTGVGAAQIQAGQGRYEMRDPADSEALWQITDPELSKANTRPCGSDVAFALKDRSRVVYDLADGNRIGTFGVPSLDSPDTNLDQLRCVGSSGDTLVFANPNQLTAFDARRGSVRWELPVIGTTQVVDGYIVLTQGTSLSVLRPN